MVLKPVVQWKNPWLRFFGFLIFFPLSLLLYLILTVRLFYYRFIFKNEIIFKTPVISVGSLLAGGSGKTPLVLHLAMRLVARGMTVAVISHGYRKQKSGLVLVSDGKKITADVYSCGDEAFMMAKEFIRSGCIVPVLSSPNRVKAVRYIESAFHPDCILLDDGAQYLKLHKTCEILTRDYRDLSDHQFLLPLGRRRDLSRSRSGSEISVITKVPENSGPLFRIDAYRIKAQHISRYIPTRLESWINNEYYDPGMLNGKKLILFSALGMNDSFHQTVYAFARRQGATIKGVYEFQDHHWYTKRNLEKMTKRVQTENDENYYWITTPKDAVKINAEWIPDTCHRRFLVLHAEVVFDDENAYIDSVLDAFRSYQANDNSTARS